MPLEGHWKRVHTPLRSTSRREVRTIAILAAALAIATAVVLYAALHSGSSQAGPGCIKVTAASSTGGATIQACGRAAARWCRSTAARHDAFARAVRADCRRAGYP